MPGDGRSFGAEPLTSGGASAVGLVFHGTADVAPTFTPAMSESKQHPPLRVIVDSREQAPFTFSGYPAVVEVATLASGDYSLAGFESRIAIERKSLPDLVACLGTERERFTRELVRLRGYDAAAVVVESPCFVLRSGRYLGGMNPASAWQSTIALSMRFRIPFFWGQDRTDAERICFDFLRHYQHDRRRELAALAPATSRPRPSAAPGHAMTRAAGPNAPTGILAPSAL